MALRPLFLSAVVGLAAVGALHVPAAQARGYVSIRIGTPAPYYRGGYAGGYRGGYDRGPGAVYAWVPAHWVATYRGRVWVPGRYLPVRGYGDDRGYGHGYGYDPRVIYRPEPGLRPLPGGFYYQRGGEDTPPGSYLPRVSGW